MTWRGLLLLGAAVASLVVVKPDAMNPDPKGPNPIAAVDTLFIEDMTWMEVRDAMAAGKKTVIVATGGVEQNGPYLAANKHNVVLRGTTDAIARKLGNALIAPIIGFVPEGDVSPPTMHMKYPSTVSLTEETFRTLLTEVCQCFKQHGFETIVLIGDSGGNQEGCKTVAAKLDAQWKSSGPRVLYIPEYANYPDQKKWLEERGVKQEDEGLHDDFAITAQMLAVDPTSVRMKQRIAANKFTINGVNLAPVEKSIEWGKKLIEFRADVTVQAIKKRLAEK